VKIREIRGKIDINEGLHLLKNDWTRLPDATMSGHNQYRSEKNGCPLQTKNLLFPVVWQLSFLDDDCSYSLP